MWTNGTKATAGMGQTPSFRPEIWNELSSSHPGPCLRPHFRVKIYLFTFSTRPPPLGPIPNASSGNSFLLHETRSCPLALPSEDMERDSSLAFLTSPLGTWAGVDCAATFPITVSVRPFRVLVRDLAHRLSTSCSCLCHGFCQGITGRDRMKSRGRSRPPRSHQQGPRARSPSPHLSAPLISSPNYRQGKRGTERLGDLPKVTPQSGGAWI